MFELYNNYPNKMEQEPQIVEELFLEEVFFEDNKDVVMPSFNESKEWLQYLKDCQDWCLDSSDCITDYVDDQSYYIRKIIKPINLKKNNDVENFNMVSLGSINKRNAKKKQSFKYNVGNKHIFCSSIIKDDSKPCKNKKCKQAHSFQDILYCDGKCGRIVIENNYYSGICNKRHFNETIENFMVRKNIRLFSITSAVFEFYKKPSSEFISNLLEKSKKIFNNVTVILIDEPIRETVEDFLNKKNNNNYEYDDLSLNTEEFNALWNIF